MTINHTNHLLWHEKIAEAIQKNKCAFLIGAGISKNSGIPLSSEVFDQCFHHLLKENVKPNIFERLASKSKKTFEKLNILLNSKMPFEYFMETIASVSDISPIYDIYRQGEPNTNHLFLSELAKSEKLPLLVTTNFDNCLEKAFQINKVTYELWKGEEVVHTTTNKIARIIKLHGCVSNTKSIDTALVDVASKKITDQRKKIIESLFAKGRHNLLLIMGYSCSDFFDITPVIENIEQSGKTIVFIEHKKNQKNPEIEHISNKKTNNPFEKFNGIRIYIDTDIFINQLWVELFKRSIIRTSYSFVKSDFNWKESVEKWYNQSIDKVNAFLGIFYNRVSDFEKAAHYLEKAYQENKVSHIHNLFYINLGNIFLYKNKYSEAEVSFQKCLNTPAEITDKEKVHCFIGLGSTKHAQKLYSEARVLFEKALEISMENQWLEDIAACHTGIGNAQISQGLLDESMQNHLISHDIHSKLGNHLEAGLCYMYIGNVFIEQKKYSEAIENYYLALERIEALNCTTELGRIYFCLGIAYRNYDVYLVEIGVFDFDNARLIASVNFFEKAASIFLANHQFVNLQETYDLLSIVYKELGKDKMAQTYMQRKQQVEVSNSVL